MPDHTHGGYDAAVEAQGLSDERGEPSHGPRGHRQRDMMRAGRWPRASNEVLIITGYSGAGRTGAASRARRPDWYVVDNLPPTMLPALVGMMSNDPQRVHRYLVWRGRAACLFRTLDALSRSSASRAQASPTASSSRGQSRDGCVATNPTAARILQGAGTSWTASRPRYLLAPLSSRRRRGHRHVHDERPRFPRGKHS